MSGIFSKIVLLFALTFVVASLLQIQKYSKTDLFMSDFKSFYTGALIAKSSQRKSLYDLNFQTKVQTEIFEGESNNSQILPYMDSPVLALALIPFVFLPALSAFKVFSILIYFFY